MTPLDRQINIVALAESILFQARLNLQAICPHTNTVMIKFSDADYPPPVKTCAICNKEIV